MSVRALVVGLVLVSVPLALALGLAAPGHAEVQVTRAELDGGDLRVEGENAVPDAPITIDGTERGQADGDGVFRIEASGFSSPNCRITVDDGTGPVEVDLDDCTPTAPEQPRWRLHHLAVMVGKEARFKVISGTENSNGLAFEFDFGDGTTVRDPETGFYPAGSSVSSAEVGHTYTTAGEFTVTATAIDEEGRTATSEPRTVTVHPDHNDCGQGTDAADTIHRGPPRLERPVDCTGHLVADPRVDSHDTYRFDPADQPLRLLTVQVTPNLPVSSGVAWIELYDAEGNLVQQSESGRFARTLETTDEMMLRIGTFNLTENVDYRLRVHSGGGGDDCVSGRGPTSPELTPLDAPNNSFTLQILEGGEVDCVGSLPVVDRDHRERYSFDVEAGELVALNILDNPESAPEDHCRQGAVRVEMARENQFVPRLGCHVEFFEALDSGRVTLDIHRGVDGTGRDVDYRMQLATSRAGRHEGDCFTGGDAGDGFAVPVALETEAAACIGALGAGDTEDWYSLPGSDGDQLFIQENAGAFYELYDPDGELHARRGDADEQFILDQTGDWRLRLASKWPDGREPFEGAYGFWTFPRRGVPGMDCGTDADTPTAGLDVTLPIDCEGSFLPFGDDTFDRYNFDLQAGQTAEISVATHSTRSEWTATIDTPSASRVQRHTFQSGGRTFTHTAEETGTYSLALERSPATDSLDLAYSVAIRTVEDAGEVELRPRVFTIGGSTTLVRGNTYCLETRVAVPSDSPPAEDVTITLSESPQGAIRLDERFCDSFGTDADRTRSVNIGGIPSPDEEAFVWAIEARDAGEVDITLTAEDVSGATATATRTFTIQD